MYNGQEAGHRDWGQREDTRGRGGGEQDSGSGWDKHGKRDTTETRQQAKTQWVGAEGNRTVGTDGTWDKQDTGHNRNGDNKGKTKHSAETTNNR